MKYYIEFELPDNDVVLEQIEHEWIRWSVWGYSGYAYAKPVACENPDLMLNKEAVLQAGKENREVEFRIGGRLFRVREVAQ